MTLKKDFIILKDNCKIALAKHEFLFKFAAHSGSSFTSYRRDGRVVECTGLENQRTERYRGFESLSLRQKHLKTSVLRWFFLCPYANEACFSEQNGHKNTGRRRWTGFQVFLVRFPSRDLLSEAKKIPATVATGTLPNLGYPLFHRHLHYSVHRPNMNSFRSEQFYSLLPFPSWRQQ